MKDSPADVGESFFVGYECIFFLKLYETINRLKYKKWGGEMFDTQNGRSLNYAFDRRDYIFLF